MPSWVNNGGGSQEPSKQRKRWEIEDKKLLKNLKYQLANDGSSDVQYDLGKQLLEDTDGKSSEDLSRERFHKLMKSILQTSVTYLDKSKA